MIDGDRLAEINVRTRSVRTVLESPGIASAGVLITPSGVRDAEEPDRKIELLERVVVRLPDRADVLNPSADERVTFPLPQKWRSDKGLALYQLSAEQALVTRTTRRGKTTELAWIDREGKVAKEASVELSGYVGASPRNEAVAAMAIAPVPLLITPVMLGPLALGQVVLGEASTYGEGVRQIMSAAWPPFVVMIAVCLAAAWYVARRQREFGWKHTALWSVAVFLTGVPGLVAYLVEHRREPKALCPACGRSVPRKREKCVACSMAFPEPRMLGTEVFA
jgi:hypothetical protein